MQVNLTWSWRGGSCRCFITKGWNSRCAFRTKLNGWIIASWMKWTGISWTVVGVPLAGWGFLALVNAFFDIVGPDPLANLSSTFTFSGYYIITLRNLQVCWNYFRIKFTSFFFFCKWLTKVDKVGQSHQDTQNVSQWCHCSSLSNNDWWRPKTWQMSFICVGLGGVCTLPLDYCVARWWKYGI